MTKVLPDDERRSYLIRLEELSKCSDYEYSHIEADDILCEILQKLGYSDIVREFNNLGKWYA